MLTSIGKRQTLLIQPDILNCGCKTNDDHWLTAVQWEGIIAAS